PIYPGDGDTRYTQKFKG
nr:anti-bacterial ssDNA antibody heavy chain CDR2 region [mice, BALB/c, hybridoma SECF5/1, Peptide Partial, 17 aa] [Mus sp.]AAB27641.1 anti-bacterial ssDNA antibody heavy chain CDR2 region [mice, BALB/c, hybridoma SECF5/5, Peptide Partial, 17 aa] [Mus sp.]